MPHSQPRTQRTRASSTLTGHVCSSGKKRDSFSFRPTCRGSIDLAMQPVEDKSRSRASPSKSSSPKKKRRQVKPTRRALRSSLVSDIARPLPAGKAGPCLFSKSWRRLRLLLHVCQKLKQSRGLIRAHGDEFQAECSSLHPSHDG